MAVELETAVLIRKGHDVKTILYDNRSVKGLFSKIFTGLRSVYNFAAAEDLSKTILSFKPDVIHIHNLFFVASPSVIYAANRHKIPVILTLHNYRLICANALLLRNNEVCELCTQKKLPFAGIKYKCYRNSSTASALVTAITGFHKFLDTWKNKVSTYIILNEFSKSKLLHSSLQVPEHKMITKPNFVPDPGEGSADRENFFLFAGRISKEKGVHVLAKAFAGMPEYKIVIAGDGPEKNLLQEEFNAYSNICFAGQLGKEQVNAYMKKCKAFICPSIWYEGAPLTIIESFATGTPVIASRLGSMAETIIDGFNGLHFTAGDADDLRKKIELFIKETEQHSMFYKNARQTYLEKYHENIHYKAILKIYQETIRKNNV